MSRPLRCWSALHTAGPGRPGGWRGSTGSTSGLREIGEILGEVCTGKSQIEILETNKNMFLKPRRK